MTNPYFERPSSVAAGTTIRSDKYNSDLDAHESAFNALHDKLQHAVFLPETFGGNPNIPEQTVNDTFIYIDTSGNIALYPIATILEQFELVGQRYNQIDSWQQQVAGNALSAQESASLSQSFANEDEDVEVLSGLYSAKHWSKKAEAQLPIIQSAGQAKVDEAQAKVDLAQQAVLAAQDEVSNAQSQVGIASGHATNAAASATLSDNFANYTYNQTIPNSGGKYSSSHWAEKSRQYAEQTLATVNGDFVPSGRTVNGKALSSDININVNDIPDIADVAKTGNYSDLIGVPTNLVFVGNYGLGAQYASFYQAGDDLNVVTDTRIFLAADAGPAAWNSDGVYFYPMGLNLYRSNLVKGQIAQGWSGSEGAIIKHRAGNAEGTGWQPWQTLWDDRNLPNPVNASDLSEVATSGDFNDLYNKPTASSLGVVPTSITVNNKPLTGDITLNASDVGALPSNTNLSTLGGVPTSRKINGKSLTGNITLSPSDVGALPDTEQGHKATRVTGSFTATRLAGVSQYTSLATANSTCTVNDSAFASYQSLIIHKQFKSGRMDIVSGSDMWLPDGTVGTSHHIPDGVSATVELHFTGNSAYLRIY